MNIATTKSSFSSKVLNVLPWLGIMGILIGFLHNRVVANCGFLLIGVYAVYHYRRAKDLLKNPWAWTFVAMAIVPLCSDVVIEGLDCVRHRGVMKLLLLLFLLFVFTWRPQRREIQLFNYAFIFVMLYASLYSCVLYFTNFETTNANYRVSKVMEVLARNDHIRISWAIVIACLLACYEFSKSTSRSIKGLLIAYLLFQILFLHILTSKLGLVMLYISALILIGHIVIKSARWWALMVIPILALIPYLSFKYIPSFEQRLRYVKYDWEFYSEGNFRNGLSDAVRYFSLVGGVDLIKERPILGHGYSRLQTKINAWYASHLPEMGVESYFLPSSEIVIYWASGGLLGLVSILAHLFVPYFIPVLRRSVWFLAFFIPASISFCIETHLEGLLPTWVYGWFAVWFWWMSVHYDSEKVAGLLDRN
jgi:O-antigen ligase